MNTIESDGTKHSGWTPLPHPMPRHPRLRVHDVRNVVRGLIKKKTLVDLHCWCLGWSQDCTGGGDTGATLALVWHPLWDSADGEDPLVTSHYAVSYFRGLQGASFIGGKLRLQVSSITVYEIQNCLFASLWFIFSCDFDDGNGVRFQLMAADLDGEFCVNIGFFFFWIPYFLI